MTDSFKNALPSRGQIDSVSDNAGASADLKKARRQRAASTNGHIDRLPPHSPEAEQGVLGCMLLSPRDCVPQVIIKLNGNPDVMYDLRHQTIMAHMIQMSENGKEIDVITLQQRLKDFELLEECSGIQYLNALQDTVPSSANLSYYTDIVLEKYLLRRAVQICTDVVSRVYECQSDVYQLLDEIERDVLSIRGNLGRTESYGAKELVQQSLSDIEIMAKRDGSISGIATGFADFDKMTDGLHPGDMVIIAARPSMGKTSLAMNIAEQIVLRAKLPVGVFSLEMTARSLMTRAICSNARVNLRNVRDGFLAEVDFPKLVNAAGRLSASLLRIDDTASLSIMSLRARARAMWQQYGIKLFVVDYLQLLHSTTRRSAENRQQEVTEISSGIKALAKELNVPIIVLSQLNRQLERDKNRKPKLADLRESGAIEQDADVVGLLYKPKFDDEDEVEEADGIPVNLLIAKQRNGPTGDVALTFLKPYTRFESAARVSDDDVPESQGELQT